MLTDGQQGILVCTELNHLWYSSQDEDAKGCCPQCCGPCHVLAELHLSGRLNETVMLAPAHYWSDAAWWNEGGVMEPWLLSSWHCTSQPRCDRDATDE